MSRKVLNGLVAASNLKSFYELTYLFKVELIQVAKTAPLIDLTLPNAGLF